MRYVYLTKAKTIHKRHPSSYHRGCYIRTMTTRVRLGGGTGRDPQKAWHQDEQTGSKLPVIN
jgi:hypothetical protein